ncbi:MAG: hypothetical protein U0791_09895 [Gemmataceae bacterium]
MTKLRPWTFARLHHGRPATHAGTGTRRRRLTAKLEAAYRDETRRVARLFASKPDSQLLGKTEFELRDRLLHLGAVTLETALAERKGGAKGPA